MSRLFQSHKLGPFNLSNRIVYAPLTRCRAIDSNPQDNMLEYYQQRARGSEGGLILAEGTVISETGFGYAACTVSVFWHSLLAAPSRWLDHQCVTHCLLHQARWLNQISTTRCLLHQAGWLDQTSTTASVTHMAHKGSCRCVVQCVAQWDADRLMCMLLQHAP